ncbi:MAG: hypothetical protein NZ934_00765 [Hadesarchaea archaeon]|nr:hypothetical protein [Hadesarchaea archaeon]
MLITTSRRPTHRARLLGRELARVLPGAEYVPRGLKTIEKLASMAGSRGYDLVMIINSGEGKPKELRFLHAGPSWKWSDARIELCEVRLQRDLSKRAEARATAIAWRGSAEARELAGLLSELWGLPLVELPSHRGAVALVIGDRELELQFRESPASEPVGPTLRVARFRRGSSW